MAKLKFDVTGVERGDRKLPTPGLYKGKIKDIEQGESKSGNSMLTVRLQITDRSGPQKEFKGSTLRTYVLLDNEASAWKLAEFLDAVGATNGGKKNKGSIDLDALVGTEIQFKVESGEYNGEYSPSVGRLMSMDEVADDDGADDADDADDDEEEEDDEAEDDEEEEEEDDEAEDYTEWSVADLKDLCEERGLPKSGGKSALIARIVEDDENADDPFA